jgi:RNA polymerase sigma-70 factor (ECF subfamily)
MSWESSLTAVEFLSLALGREDTGVTAPDPLRPLLDAAREGDDQAVAELVRRSQADVWRLCVALGSPGEEQDLVQETYLRALGSLGTYRGEAPVRAWLLSVARNVCADHVRRRERQRRLLDRVRPHPLDAVSPAHTSIDDLLAELGPDRREAFVLTQMLGLSYEEAAATLGCPIGTVRSRVARARADLAAEVRRIQAI